MRVVDRRRLGPAARGPRRGCSRTAGIEVVAPGRRRARTCCARSRAQARRRGRRRADAADPHRRGPARRARDPRRAARHRRARALPVRRGALRARAARRDAPASATCSRTASPTSTGFADAVRRVADGGPRSTPRSSRSCSAARRRDDPLDELTPREREVLELMAEGRSNTRDRRGARRHRARRREARHGHLHQARPPSGGDDHRRVLAVLRFLDQPALGGASEKPELNSTGYLADPRDGAPRRVRRRQGGRAWVSLWPLPRSPRASRRGRGAAL